jgi:hypothetical protein
MRKQSSSDDISLKEYVDTRLASDAKAVEAALAAAKEAVAIAEQNSQRWRTNANEWRGAMSDRERDFLTRKEFYAIVATAAAVITLFMAVFK